MFESDGSVLESEIWIDLHAARRAVGMDGTLSSLNAVLTDPASHETFALPRTEDKQIPSMDATPAPTATPNAGVSPRLRVQGMRDGGHTQAPRPRRRAILLPVGPLAMV